MSGNLPDLWTLGHSTRTLQEFLEILRHYEIEILADVRHFPSSRRFPHFNKAALSETLTATGIRYEHLLELGGRRPVKPDSRNTAWRHPAFRGYADYMESREFRDGVEHLLAIAGTGGTGRTRRTAILCAEAVWWRCHRSMIADYLKARGGRVFHILSLSKVQEHPYTSAARIVNGQLSYEEPETEVAANSKGPE